MDYKKKYLKYKKKYNNLKNLYGGDLEEEKLIYLKKLIAQFITKNNYIYSNSMMGDYFRGVDIAFVPEELFKLFKYLYKKLSEESRKKKVITIFSFSTGFGVVEILFALFLKIIHNKKCKMIFVEPFNPFIYPSYKENIGEYNDLKTFFNHFNIDGEQVFDATVDLLNEDEGLLNKRCDIMLMSKYKDNQFLFDIHPNIKKICTYLRDSYDIDIFLSNNPQGFTFIQDYFTNSFYNSDDKIKFKNDINMFKIHNNNNLLFIYKFINMIKTKEEQKQIPVINILWNKQDGNGFNLDNIEDSLKYVVKHNIGAQDGWGIKEKDVVTTLDNINNIFKIPLENELNLI
jgi:hypothetical protein